MQTHGLAPENQLRLHNYAMPSQAFITMRTNKKLRMGLKAMLSHLNCLHAI
jgi:hypothetical protein